MWQDSARCLVCVGGGREAEAGGRAGQRLVTTMTAGARCILRGQRACQCVHHHHLLDQLSAVNGLLDGDIVSGWKRVRGSPAAPGGAGRGGLGSVTGSEMCAKRDRRCWLGRAGSRCREASGCGGELRNGMRAGRFKVSTETGRQPKVRKLGCGRACRSWSPWATLQVHSRAGLGPRGPLRLSHLFRGCSKDHVRRRPFGPPLAIRVPPFSASCTRPHLG